MQNSDNSEKYKFFFWMSFSISTYENGKKRKAK